jgi:subtilisin family serine protease
VVWLLVDRGRAGRLHHRRRHGHRRGQHLLRRLRGPGRPDSAVAFQAYADAIAYARSKGILIVGSTGNAHVRIGRNGRITSHGQLTAPGTAPEDFVNLFGYYRVPTGPPGALVVSATGNLVNQTSATRPPGTADNANATCKPASDAHQPFGVGKRNQLAYYSNYGARIDIAAPGGARKFNLPTVDRGGTPGFPVTASDLTNAWQTFSTTSNWAVEIPCYTFTTGSGFPQGQCYSTIQGTSMAAPHAAAAVALIASEHPSLRHRPGRWWPASRRPRGRCATTPRRCRPPTPPRPT